jgi:hypothetical protein
VTEEILSVIRGTSEAQIDMNGVPDRFRTQKLCIRRVINGHPVNVEIAGLMVSPVLENK